MFLLAGTWLFIVDLCDQYR